MNYLGHLYFSGDNHALMLAQLYGDFVKGKDYSYLPKIVQEGVYLHRQIDDFIDRHPKVTELRLLLYGDLPKIAGVAIDLYFDHLLAYYWVHYHKETLDNFVDQFFDFALASENQFFETKHFNYPKDFTYLVNMIHKYNWLKKYAYFDGLNTSLENLSKRISFPNKLDVAGSVFQSQRSIIEDAFKVFMEDAKIRFDI